MKYGLNDTTITQLQQVFKRFPQIEQVILYGSRAKGNYKPGSDIDLTLKGENLTLSVMSDLNLMLDDLLLPYMFDISVFSRIKNQDLLEHINSAGVIFYNKASIGA